MTHLAGVAVDQAREGVDRGGREDARRDRAERPADAVDGEDVERVVDPKPLAQERRAVAQPADREPDEHRAAGGHVARRGRDRDEPGDRATRRPEDADLALVDRSVIAGAVGDRIAIVDSATATASALSELLIVNGLEAPGTTRGTAADAGLAGHERPDETPAAPTRRLATTGDPERFRDLAVRLFGPDVAAVESVELGALVR